MSIFSGGYAMTYFAVDIGLWACVISMGFCSGLAISLCHSNIITTAMKVLHTKSLNCCSKPHMLNLQWFPNKRGLMGSIVGAGSGGSIIWIPLQTAYVNPDNVAAVEVDGEDDRFMLQKIRNHAHMTCAKFSDFWSPSPLVSIQ